MNQFIQHCDNAGNRSTPHPGIVAPVAASGQTVDTGTADDDVTLTVIAGATYALTCIGASVLASTTGVTSIAANVEWSIPTNVTVLVHIPVGKTTLYLKGDTGSKAIRIVRLANTG